MPTLYLPPPAFPLRLSVVPPIEGDDEDREAEVDDEEDVGGLFAVRESEEGTIWERFGSALVPPPPAVLASCSLTQSAPPSERTIITKKKFNQGKESRMKALTMSI
jgi:hypothetical protein